MNKIEELIQQLCPNGVELKELRNVAAISIGEFVHKNKQSPDAKYPVFNGGISNTGFYDEYNNTGNKIIMSARGVNAGFVNKILVNYWAGNSCYSISIIDDLKLDWNFVYHILKQNQNKFICEQQTGSIPAVSKKQVEKFQIPIPPLPIQQEMVSILDKFTTLEAELEAELEARTRQYEYYRNQLLNFEGKGVEWKALGVVCLKTENIKWKENQNEDFQYIDLSSVSRENNKIYDTKTINSSNAPSRAQQIVIENDVIFGTTRPTLKRYSLIPSVYHNQICSTGFCVLRANQKVLLPKFLFFMLTTTGFYNYVENNQEGAGYPSISNNSVKKYKIPIPPLSEQERIVSILDKFDALVNDISVGLPAEIAARRKQYEYYRGKLLNFKNVND
jgi:type I restriction enzyme S subunit